MNQESRLAVTIDSRGAQRDTRAMTKDLNALESAGNRVDPAMDKAQAGIREMGNQASTSASKVRTLEGQTDRLASVVTGLAGPIAAAFSVAKIAAAAEQYVNLTNRLRLVTEGSEQLAFAQESVYQVAQNSRQTLEVTAQVYQRVAQNARQLGLDFADVASVTETVAKTVALSGASTQAADAAMVQFGQALASGTLRGDELNSIMEQTPALAQAIARGLGVTIGQLRAMGAEGKLTSAAVVQALQNQKDKVDELSSAMTLTVGQAITSFNNALITTVGRLDEATGASSRLAGGIAALARAMDGFNSGEFLDFFRKDKQTVAGLNNELSVTMAGVRDLQNARSRLAKDDPSDTVFFKFKFYDQAEIDAEIKELEGKSAAIRTIVSKMESAAAGTGAQKPKGEDPATAVNAEYEKMLASLKKQAALQGVNTEAAKVRYAIETGELGKLLPEQEKLLLKYAEEKDAKVAAEKASKDAAAAATKAAAAQGKGLPEALNTFSRLYAQYDPAAEAARALAKEEAQLQLAFTRGKITQDEYSKALAQSSTNYASAIKGAQGLTAVEQYRAQLQKQLANERDQYALDAASIGMGDLQTSRMQQRLNLEMQTNDRLLQLQTELANATDEKQRQALQGQIDAINEFLPQQLAAMQAGWAQIDQAMLNPINGWTAAVQNFGNQARDIAGQTQSIFSSAFNTISTDITDAIMSGQLSMSTLGDIASNVVREIIAGFVKMGVQMALNAALNATLGTAAAGQSMILAGTTATAWAPAAAMASLATLGANSVPAAAALTSTTALASSLAVIPGFATGGYVSGAGTGTSDSIMARLSDGEFVVNAAATKRNRALLEAINSNERVSVAGGGGSVVSTQSAGSTQAPVVTQPSVTVNLIEDRSRAGTVDQRTGDDGQLQIDAFVADIWGGGERAQAIEAAYGLSRNPT
ncbi:tape measure protein [Pseudomonas asiatica]|uniref:tape measure protein n=1 Tax=Pseudomonas asiatica TaxID=2219225 RepID=UPI00209AB873|nr:tape measure protein [Pseudomonas asiatica]MCO7536722.1 tape measure protein [Pseudomonas asiatica]MCO7550463.1 tape measure protein [Pseudomonas asiatica]MCO7560036.1 tape measure protein [Pseudomonas asiatica]